MTGVKEGTEYGREDAQSKARDAEPAQSSDTTLVVVQKYVFTGVTLSKNICFEIFNGVFADVCKRYISTMNLTTLL